MSSIEPNGCGGEVDGGEEVSRGLVVAGGDGAELLELGEEVFDEMPGLVEGAVPVAGRLSVSLGRNDRRFARREERRDHTLVGVEGLVGDDDVRSDQGQQPVGAGEVVLLAAGQGEAGRVAERVDQGVDLGRQSAFAPPDGLLRAPFLRAPALC